MRKMLTIGTGVAAAAAAVVTAAAAASAAPGTHQQAIRPAVAAAAAHHHVTKAQARQIAQAKVPHSRAIEVQSDDLHDRAVWKVTLATPHGRVIVAVSKHTGKATIVRGPGGAHGDAARASGMSASAGTGWQDHGNLVAAAARSRDARDLEGAREDRDALDHEGAREDRRDRDDHHDQGRGDDSPDR